MGELPLECHNSTMCSISYATATSIVKACSTYISDRLLTGQSHLSATTTYQATESVASDALSDSWWALYLFVCGASSGARGGENEESHHPRHFLGSISHTTVYSLPMLTCRKSGPPSKALPSDIPIRRVQSLGCCTRFNGRESVQSSPRCSALLPYEYCFFSSHCSAHSASLSVTFLGFAD
ncbi:hypothetical protein ASPFODRAFT_500763 [Aspergillus luchuensis CBS 106.47]|uniref:Uncharacterized protein n=1 Tax=Aspergillus luchuensis (strain CBS 106.47) TaxID=1137211 RepID=A0A1M3TSH7_ASPLC|nr:hypothetical protein ASPFODRAFT_500763 [Aspergillus luchuensis CBS 106.47]